MRVGDVINGSSKPRPDDHNGLFQYHATRIVAAIITHTYSYMVDRGIHYGCITTGEAFVFLHLPQDEPGTVRYSLVEPEADANAQKHEYPESKGYLYRTPVAQLLSFILMALEPEGPRPDTPCNLDTWTVDVSEIFDEMPEAVRNSPPHTSHMSEIFCWA